MQDSRDMRVGLVGGDVDRRVDTARVPPLDLAHVFAPLRRPDDQEALEDYLRAGVVHLEVGFGRAHHLCALARQDPERRVLGFETKREWCRVAAKRAERQGLQHLRVIEGDARPYLERLIPDGSIDVVHALFPDPWWKRRHHKRRLFQAGFVDTVHRVLKPGGSLIARTDVPSYGDLVEEVVGAHTGLDLVGASLSDPLLATLPRSHRETKCAEFGIPVFRFRYLKKEIP